MLKEILRKKHQPDDFSFSSGSNDQQGKDHFDFKNFKNAQFHNNAGGNKKKPRSLKGNKTFKFVLKTLLILILLFIIFFDLFYTVEESEAGVLFTFGKVTSLKEPGLHFKLPAVFQKVVKVPVNRTLKLELGYYQDEEGYYHSQKDDDSIMITGDMNVVDIDFFMEYKISDPVKYLTKSANPEEIIRHLLMSSARSVVGTKSIDETLTTGKFEIQTEVKDLLREKLEEHDIGLAVVDVKVNDSEPADKMVTQAFRDVETAKQEKDTAINKASQYSNRKIPEAEGQADYIIKEAEAYKESRINEAEGLTARYLAMYEAYAQFPEITEERMYLEALREILPDVTLILDGDGSTFKYLPLGSGANAVLPAPASVESDQGEKDVYSQKKRSEEKQDVDEDELDKTLPDAADDQKESEDEEDQ